MRFRAIAGFRNLLVHGAEARHWAERILDVTVPHAMDVARGDQPELAASFGQKVRVTRQEVELLRSQECPSAGLTHVSRETQQRVEAQDQPLLRTTTRRYGSSPSLAVSSPPMREIVS